MPASDSPMWMCVGSALDTLATFERNEDKRWRWMFDLAERTVELMQNQRSRRPSRSSPSPSQHANHRTRPPRKYAHASACAGKAPRRHNVGARCSPPPERREALIRSSPWAAPLRRCEREERARSLQRIPLMEATDRRRIASRQRGGLSATAELRTSICLPVTGRALTSRPSGRIRARTARLARCYQGGSHATISTSHVSDRGARLGGVCRRCGRCGR